MFRSFLTELALKGMGNMMDSMKKAQDIAKQAELINKELTATVVIGNGKEDINLQLIIHVEVLMFESIFLLKIHHNRCLPVLMELECHLG